MMREMIRMGIIIIVIAVITTATITSKCNVLVVTVL
jgi:hypothetical protein